jgi:hypothetical protein
MRGIGLQVLCFYGFTEYSGNDGFWGGRAGMDSLAILLKPDGAKCWPVNIYVLF